MGVVLDELPVDVAVAAVVVVEIPPLVPPYARPKLKFDDDPSTAGVGAPLVAAR